MASIDVEAAVGGVYYPRTTTEMSGFSFEKQFVSIVGSQHHSYSSVTGDCLRNLI